MRGPRGNVARAPPQPPRGVSTSRIEEVLQFTRELDESGVESIEPPLTPGRPPAITAGIAGARPPLPAITKPVPEDKPAQKSGARHANGSDVAEGASDADVDLVEIMSAASEASRPPSAVGSAVSSLTRNGRTRRTLVL